MLAAISKYAAGFVWIWELCNYFGSTLAGESLHLWATKRQATQQGVDDYTVTWRSADVLITSGSRVPGFPRAWQGSFGFPAASDPEILGPNGPSPDPVPDPVSAADLLHGLHLWHALVSESPIQGTQENPREMLWANTPIATQEMVSLVCECHEKHVINLIFRYTMTCQNVWKCYVINPWLMYMIYLSLMSQH